MLRLRVPFALAFVLAAATVIVGQTGANDVYVGQSFQVAGTHDGVNATAYRLYRQGPTATTPTLVQTLTAAQRNAATGDVVFGVRTETTAGTVRYELAAVNDTVESLTRATIDVNVFACTYAITPTTRTSPAGGETTSFTMSAPAPCAWTASTAYAWLTVSGGSGSGNGTITVTVAPHTGTATRTGTVVVGGRVFTVTQTAAPAAPAAMTLPRLIKVTP